MREAVAEVLVERALLLTTPRGGECPLSRTVGRLLNDPCLLGLTPIWYLSR